MKWLELIARRLGYVPAMPHLRAWGAAQQSRLTSGWAASPLSINREIRSNLVALRARSREQAQNNDYARKFLSLVQTNVVGHQGITLQAKAADPGGTLDVLANQAIEDGWQRFSRYGVPDVTGAHSGKSLQRQFIRSVAQDGEVFVMLDEDSKFNEFGFSVQFMDPDSVDVTLNIDKLNNGNALVMGVELTKYGRPAAYYVRDQSPGVNGVTYSGRKYRRIGADKIFHRFLPEWIMGTRGVPWMSTSLLRMAMLEGYEEAELIAARTAASKMGFFVEKEGNPYTADGVDAEGNLITDAEPGTFERLPGGVEFQPWDPQHPNSAYDTFVKAALRGISSGLGVSYNSLGNDLEGVNFSSLRQGALEERATWMMLQDWMIETFMMPLYEKWLKSALQHGALTVTGAALKPERFQKYMNVSWQARRWGWVDPTKEMDAYQVAIDLGIKSRSEIIREQGRDPADVWQEIAKEREEMTALGIPLDTSMMLQVSNED